MYMIIMFQTFQGVIYNNLSSGRGLEVFMDSASVVANCTATWFGV